MATVVKGAIPTGHVSQSRTITRRPVVRPVVLYVVTTVLAVLFLFPFAWSVLSGLKSANEMYAYPPVFVPAHPLLSNYVTAFTLFPFATWYKNTMIVVVLNTTGLVLSSSIVAYGFARFEFRFKSFLFAVTLGGAGQR